MKYNLPENPLISVLCCSFNHEKYVGFFIESLLSQTYKNWELIIMDDCSQDGNVNEILKYDDSRIHLNRMEFNSGSSVLTSKAFEMSKGDIIIDNASDDAFKPIYFETVVELFKENSDIGAINNSLDIIDENNIHYDFYYKKNRDKYDLLNEFFYKGNVLYSPGLAVRRCEYEKLCPMNFAFIQHQDYKWHLQLLLNTEYITLEEPYVYYRVSRKESSSLGTLSNAALNRYHLEEDYLMDTFLTVKDPVVVERIVQNEKYKNISLAEIPFVYAMCIQDSENEFKRQWGYKTLLRYFENSDNLELIHNKYGFEFKDMLGLSGCDFGYIYTKKNNFLLAFKFVVKKLLIHLHLLKKKKEYKIEF